jgi:hypothetical protein
MLLSHNSSISAKISDHQDHRAFAYTTSFRIVRLMSLGQKPFKRSLRGSDAVSETSSVSHIEDLEKVEQLSSGLEHDNLEAHSPEQPPRATDLTARQTEALQNQAQHQEDDHSQVEELERLR